MICAQATYATTLRVEGTVVRRFVFANKRLRKYAHQKAHATKGGPVTRYRRLPMRKGIRRR